MMQRTFSPRLRLQSALAAAALALCALPAMAADDHAGHNHRDHKAGAAHAHDDKSTHGGVVSVVKDVNYELVAKADSLALYITDHGKPVAIQGASAKVTLLGATGKTEATLAPAGDKLEATGAFKVAAGTKAAVTVTLAGQAPVAVKFTLK